MSKNIEFKSFSLKLEDVDSQGTIRGYASTFGNVDLGFDVVDKGAFKKSIKESNATWPILADHNPSKQIGWNFRAEEDDKGLFVEGKLDLNVQDAREKYSLAKSAMELGAKMGLSIGYMVVKAEPDRANPIIRRLKELKMYEYSIVTFPMNTEAMITSAKGLGNVDRARYLIQQFEESGIKRDELMEALAFKEQAADKDDPHRIVQSLDELIKMIKS